MLSSEWTLPPPTPSDSCSRFSFCLFGLPEKEAENNFNVQIYREPMKMGLENMALHLIKHTEIVQVFPDCHHKK